MLEWEKHIQFSDLQFKWTKGVGKIPTYKLKKSCVNHLFVNADDRRHFLGKYFGHMVTNIKII